MYMCNVTVVHYVCKVTRMCVHRIHHRRCIEGRSHLHSISAPLSKSATHSNSVHGSVLLNAVVSPSKTSLGPAPKMSAAVSWRHALELKPLWALSSKFLRTGRGWRRLLHPPFDFRALVLKPPGYPKTSGENNRTPWLIMHFAVLSWLLGQMP